MNKIKQLRIAKGLKQKELASLLNTTSQSILNWENGLHLPRIEKLQQIANILGCSLDYLMDFKTYADSIEEVCDLIEKMPPRILADAIREYALKKNK